MKENFQPNLTSEEIDPKLLETEEEVGRAEKAVNELISEKQDLKKETEITTEKTLLEKLDDSPIPLRKLAYDLLGQGKKQEAEELIEKIPSVSELREAVLANLEKASLIQFAKEGLVVDLENIQNVNLSDLFFSLPKKFKSSNQNLNKETFYDGRVATNLYYTFKDIKVIAKSDYERGNFEAKPLFYIPDNLESAFDPAQIKLNNFHLAPWDLGPVLNKSVYTKEGLEVNQFNEATALLIFHPQYGNGERDDNGVLQVNYADGSRRPITYRFFEQYKDLVLNRKKSSEAIRSFLEETEVSELSERGLLLSSDFQPEQKRASKAEETVVQSGIKPNGLVSFYDQQKRLIRYYVGKSAEFTKDPDIEVVRLNDNLAIIMKKNATGRYISHYFNLTNYEDERLTQSSTNTGEFKVATAGLTKVGAYNINNEQQDDAKSQDLARFTEILNITNRIQELSGVDILLAIKKQTTWDNVLNILSQTKQSPESVAEFIQKFGEEKLLLFLETSVSADEFNQYLSLGENIEQVTAQKILDKYAEIVDLVNKSQEELAGQLVDGSSDFEIDPSKEILERANKILLRGADKYRHIKQAGSQADYLQMMKELDRVKADLILTFAVYKNLKGRVRPEDLQGVSFEKMLAQDFQGLELVILEMGKGKYPAEKSDEDPRITDLRQMFQLYELNYADKPELKIELLGSFAENLIKNNQQTDLFLIRKNSQIVAYQRVDQEDGSQYKHYASFNVLPEIQSLGIGDYLIEAVEGQLANQKAKAECLPFSTSCSLSLERNNFVVNKSVSVKGADNVFEILRDGQEKKYYYQGQSKEQIMAEAQTEPFEIANLSQQEKFVLSSASDFNKNLPMFLQLIDELGYKITRYFFDKASQKYYVALERGSN